MQKRHSINVYSLTFLFKVKAASVLSGIIYGFIFINDFIPSVLGTVMGRNAVTDLAFQLLFSIFLFVPVYIFLVYLFVFSKNKITKKVVFLHFFYVFIIGLFIIPVLAYICGEHPGISALISLISFFFSLVLILKKSKSYIKKRG